MVTLALVWSGDTIAIAGSGNTVFVYSGNSVIAGSGIFFCRQQPRRCCCWGSSTAFVGSSKTAIVGSAETLLFSAAVPVQ